MSQKLQQLREKYDAARKELETQGKSAFMAVVAELFVAEPLLQSFSWTQYAPYFNDGDPCTFSVHGVNKINGYDRWADEEEETEVEHLEDCDHKRLEQKAEEIVNALPDDIMQNIFGSDAQVTVFKNGKIEIDEYSHD